MSPEALANGKIAEVPPSTLGSMEELADPNIHDRLKALRLDELITLAHSSSATRTVKEDDSFPRSIVTPTIRYVQYLYSTWSNIVRAALSNEIPLVDLFWTVVFALLTSLLLFFALLFCEVVNNPFITNTYKKWAGKYANGLGIVNAANPGLFNALTTPQVQAAKNALSLPIEDSVNNSHQRVFDLDIAKFLLQFAAVVYERDPNVIHQTLRETFQSSPKANRVHSPSASAARHSGSQALNSAIPVSEPGRLLYDLYEPMQVKRIEAAFKESHDNSGESAIAGLCDRFEVQYEHVSELNNSSNSFCTFFWDSKSNWIVVAFKGTDPVQYSDLITDLTITLVEAEDFLPGFGKVVKGFKDRVYPSSVSDIGGTRPWDTIRFSLRILANHLARELPVGQKINVWFTGHSLGCALASLVYARAIHHPSDLGDSPIVIRDAYLFGAPVCGSRQSAVTFNNIMNDGPRLKTMWRITNADDAVATLLPHLGDRPDLKLSPTNPAAFAHLGAELKMKDYPEASNVTGNLFSNNTMVEIRSAFTRAEVLAARNQVIASPAERRREKLGILAESIPLIGRFVAHDTVLYWDQIDRIALGPVRWLTGA